MALCMMPVSVQCIGAFATADSLAKLEEDVTAFDGKLSVAEPDDTREQAKLRRKAMKEVSKQRNIYGNVAAPYLSAVRTIELYEGYNDLDEIISNYDDVVNERNARHERERSDHGCPCPRQRAETAAKEAQKSEITAKKKAGLADLTAEPVSLYYIQFTRAFYSPQG